MNLILGICKTNTGVKHLDKFVIAVLILMWILIVNVLIVYAIITIVMSDFSDLNPESVVTLFKSYCCSFYGLFLWKHNSDTFGKYCTQWNKCIRIICYLPYNTHIWLLCHLIG